MLERLELLVGSNIDKIKNLHVLILGLGGVGGYALESIVRCGIKEVTIIDADTIDETNLNRQIIATRSNIGRYKTDAFYDRLKDINPDLVINKITKYIEPNDIEELFTSKHIDYIIDCCDAIKTKEALISYAIINNIKIISSMGTGNKLHPEKLEIVKLSKTSYDPIAKKLRKYLHDNHPGKDIYVVCSKEEKIVNNITTIPSNSFVPATAGLLCTSFIINDVIK
jgi:tRNA A37 threonylcarbamoyladenosine dehydratase